MHVIENGIFDGGNSLVMSLVLMNNLSRGRDNHESELLGATWNSRNSPECDKVGVRNLFKGLESSRQARN